MSEPSVRKQPIYQRPVEILQSLIRFDTTNPPGNEAECVAYVNGLLSEAGLATTLLAKAPNRPNLIARLKGQGQRTASLALRTRGCGHNPWTGLDTSAIRGENRGWLCLGAGRSGYERWRRHDVGCLPQG